MQLTAVAREQYIETDEIIGATRRWLEISVIGLELCPFAQGPYRSNRIRYSVSEQRSSVGLLQEFCEELLVLASADPVQCETTLLIHPWVLGDFVEYNEFIGACETAVADRGLEGELQVAGFHPQYRFADSESEDIENYTNRSPFPMLHLLRESSVERAAATGDMEEIYRRNIRTMRELGHAGWQRLWRE